MTHTHLNIKSSKQTHFLKSSAINRTGSGLTYFLTTKPDTTKISNPCSAMANVPSLRTCAVFLVMLLFSISCRMMARKNPRFFVKSASPALILAPTQDFPRTILSNALIAAIPLFIKKTVSTLLYINAKTLSVLTISTDLNTSVKIFPLIKSQNISFITSTVNSRQISFA